MGNSQLFAERHGIYAGLAQETIGNSRSVPILVDWTPVGCNNDFHALVATVALSGRSVKIVTKVHRLQKFGNPRVEKAFLKSLKNVVPRTCRPIIITDAGFRVPWFEAVEALGWELSLPGYCRLFFYAEYAISCSTGDVKPNDECSRTWL